MNEAAKNEAAKETVEIVRSIEVRAPIERVYRALTDAEEFSTWFQVNLDGPFRVGSTVSGIYTFPGCEGTRFLGRITAMEAPALFAYEWCPSELAEEAVSLDGLPTTLVEFRLQPVAGGTRITVRESGFEVFARADERALNLDMNTTGWRLQFDNLVAHLEAARRRA